MSSNAPKLALVKLARRPNGVGLRKPGEAVDDVRRVMERFGFGFGRLLLSFCDRVGSDVVRSVPTSVLDVPICCWVERLPGTQVRYQLSHAHVTQIYNRVQKINTN